jgi:hypothetical protein
VTDKTWKKIERQVAALLGGERVPVTGRQRGSAPDVTHPVLSIEVKHRKELPDWLLDALRQAEASRRGDQIPIAILHQKGMAVGDSLTIIRLSDMIKLLEKITEVKP